MRTKAFALVIVIALGALAALAPSAAADQPVTTITNFDRTFTVAAGPGTCPFPFTGHTEGTLRETVFSSGKDVTHAVDFHVTYSNPANGKTLTTVLAGPVLLEPDGNRTGRGRVNRNDRHLTAPRPGTDLAH